MDRGYQHNLKEKLLSGINKTHTSRNWKSALLKQNSKEEKDTIPALNVYYKRSL